MNGVQPVILLCKKLILSRPVFGYLDNHRKAQYNNYSLSGIERIGSRALNVFEYSGLYLCVDRSDIMSCFNDIRQKTKMQT